jgi:hypothetical protein
MESLPAIKTVRAGVPRVPIERAGMATSHRPKY